MFISASITLFFQNFINGACSKIFHNPRIRFDELSFCIVYNTEELKISKIVCLCKLRLIVSLICFMLSTSNYLTCTSWLITRLIVLDF